MAWCYMLKITTLLLLSLTISIHGAEDLGRGFGEKYDWHSLEDGLQIAKDTDKPLMLVIHKSWCGACKALKPKFAESTEILELSKHFVMVNTLDSEEPKDDKYSPDGGYIPRILFLNSAGDVQKQVYNTNGNPSYKHFYFDADGVVKSMKEAIEIFVHQSSSKGDEL